jgi:hypothetical protein
MVITCIILEVLGGALPIFSAITAYRRFYKGPNALNAGPNVTFGDDMLLRQEQKSALKGPAIVAGIGVISSTLAGVLSLVFLTN